MLLYSTQNSDDVIILKKYFIRRAILYISIVLINIRITYVKCSLCGPVHLNHSTYLVEDRFQSKYYFCTLSGIPQVILLTKVDKLSKEVEEDLSLVFKSSEVKEHVEKASQLLGLPRANVLPVKNYENEEELDENISILALMALRKILNFAEDFLDHMLDQKEV